MTTRYQVFRINEDGTESAESPKYLSKKSAERSRESATNVAKFEYRHHRAKGYNDYLPTFVVREVRGE